MRTKDNHFNALLAPFPLALFINLHRACYVMVTAVMAAGSLQVLLVCLRIYL